VISGKSGRSNITIVVLGRILYKLDDESGIAVVSNDTIDKVALWVRSSVSDDLDLTTRSSDTYRRCRAVASGDGREILTRMLPPELSAVTEFQFGVYHHRIVLLFSLAASNVSLGRIRQLRQYVTQYSREIFDATVKLSSGEGAIRQIVAYPLVFVRGGNRVLRKEDRLLRREGYSHLYSTTTTTFSVRVRTSRIPGDPRRHCLRVSVPGMIVYQSGRISKSLVNSITDAVYFGALFAGDYATAARFDEDNSPDGAGEVPSEMTLGTGERLRDVVAMLKDRVVSERRQEFESTLTVVSILVAVVVAIFAGLTLFHV
jgi:hypothetical protein